MSSFKFIHAADLHIESPYKGITNLNKNLGQSLVENGVKAYENLIQVALENQIDFLLIAGDSFDSDSGSLSAQIRFIKGLEKLAEKNIKVYIICGNHDPLENWAKHLQFPENVVLFHGKEVQKHIFSRNNEELAAIYGVSFIQKEEYKRWAEEYKRDDNTSFAIGLLHGTLAGNTTHVPYCPFDKDTLRASNLNYWALGHIHKREILSEDNPMMVYSGNIQGRHFNETGEKGCYLVEVNEGKVTAHNFLPLSSIIYEYASLDLTGINDLGSLLQALQHIKSEKAQTKFSYLLRINLTGRTDLYEILKESHQLNAIIEEWNIENEYHKQFFYIDKINNLTQPNIDIEERKKANDFVGNLLQNFDELLINPKEKEKYFEEEFQKIMTSKEWRIINKLEIKEELSEEISAIFENAKWKCVDGLIKTD